MRRENWKTALKPRGSEAEGEQSAEDDVSSFRSNAAVCVGVCVDGTLRLSLWKGAESEVGFGKRGVEFRLYRLCCVVLRCVSGQEASFTFWGACRVPGVAWRRC